MIHLPGNLCNLKPLVLGRLTEGWFNCAPDRATSVSSPSPDIGTSCGATRPKWKSTGGSISTSITCKQECHIGFVHFSIGHYSAPFVTGVSKCVSLNCTPPPEKENIDQYFPGNQICDKRAVAPPGSLRQQSVYLCQTLLVFFVVTVLQT
jgi:hypothetical protein